MKFLVIADPHFHAYKAHSVTGEDGTNSRLIQIIDTWKRAVKESYELGCRVLLVPGDIFHVRGALRPSVFNMVFDLMRWTVEWGYRVIMIPGNHDMENYNGGHTAIDTFDNIEGVDVLKAQAGCTVTVTQDGEIITVLGVPYFADAETFKDTFIKASGTAKAQVTLIHQYVDDIIGAGSMIPATGITSEWLMEHNNGMIITGHYHTPVLSPGGRVLNVGAMVQHNFGDEGQERGYWLYDTHGGVSTFCPLHEAPEFVTYSSIDEIKGADLDRLFIRIKATDIKAGEKIKAKCEKAGAASVHVELVREFATAHEKAIPLSTPHKMLVEYIDMMEEYAPFKDKLLALYDKLCAGGA